MAIRSFAVVGGDKRNFALAEMLYRAGHRIKLFGFATYDRETTMQCMNLSETVSGADYIIGPTPCTYNGGTLNAPFYPSPIDAESLFKLPQLHLPQQ